MDTEIVEEVTEWESRPFAGGYAGLRELAGQEFTGAVTNGTTWLFLLNGRVVASVDGSIDGFADAEGTAYEAPHPSVPLLFAMRERDGETKAKYYTEETPLSDVDETLSSGNFTGYIELSENVLSGDYYVVYHGGRSLACAFIGNSRSLLTGEEALERADDEVGIYEVRDVDVDVIPIPDEGDAAAGAGAATTRAEDESGTAPAANGGAADGNDATDAAGVSDDVLDDDAIDADDATGADDPIDGLDGYANGGLDGGDGDGAAAGVDAGDGETADASTVDDEDSTAGDSADGTAVAASDADDTGIDEAMTAPADRAATASESRSGDGADGARDATANESIEADGNAVGADSTAGEAGEAAEAGETEDPFSEEAEWRNAQSIPSLDPSNSEARADQRTVAEREPVTAAESGAAPGAVTDRNADDSAGSQANRPGETGGQPNASVPEAAGPEATANEERVAQLRERLAELEDAREEAEAAKERLAAEREELEAERDEYREEAQRLQSRVEQLESEVERLEAELEDANGAETTAARTMPSAEALTGTNLFVRYDTKGGATLEKGHAGEVEREAVVDNLRLEHHTSFDTDRLRVAGDPFEEFLRDTVEYRFVRWVVEDLLYEIRETGHEAALQELFDAIPEIDRAELDGSVGVEFQEGGDTHREQEQFDVVLRDRMGNPLIVADLNSARDPATGEMMTDLVEAARRVEDSNEALSSAFLVTTSYFQPDALETADDATGGGLLDRGKRESFVKLSRKRGFHLCLVETRDGNFHVNVPEL